jgi:hypothetical protein
MVLVLYARSITLIVAETPEMEAPDEYSKSLFRTINIEDTLRKETRPIINLWLE